MPSWESETDYSILLLPETLERQDHQTCEDAWSTRAGAEGDRPRQGSQLDTRLDAPVISLRARRTTA